MNVSFTQSIVDGKRVVVSNVVTDTGKPLGGAFHAQSLGAIILTGHFLKLTGLAS